MRTAPAVSAALDDQGLERVLIVSMHILSALALAVWAALQTGLARSSIAWLASVAWIAAAAVFGIWQARRALAADGQHLIWDGASWALTTRARRSGGALAGGTGTGGSMRTAIDRVVMTLDLGAWVLLRLQAGAGGSRWQVVRARSAGSAWQALRLALLTEARLAGPRPGQAGSGPQDR
jgi:hypothetical protein